MPRVFLKRQESSLARTNQNQELQMSALLKSIPPRRTEAREALADIIAELTSAQRQLSAIETAQRKTDEAVYAARHAVEEAEAKIEQAKSDAATHLTAIAMGSTDAAPLSVKEARASLQDAQDTLDAAISAREELAKQKPAVESDASSLRLLIDNRIHDVIMAEAPVEKMLADFATLHREFVAHRRVMEWLEGQNAIPREASFRTEPREWAEAGELPWKNAVEALRQNADAALPTG
jgi:DNA repair exonuclease SbcCD ATPase subunit